MRADTQCPKCGGNRGFLPDIDPETGIPYVKFLCPTCSPTVEKRGVTVSGAPKSARTCPACASAAYRTKQITVDGVETLTRVCMICGYRSCGKAGRKPGAKAARGEKVGRQRPHYGGGRKKKAPVESPTDGKTQETPLQENVPPARALPHARPTKVEAEPRNVASAVEVAALGRKEERLQRIIEMGERMKLEKASSPSPPPAGE